MKVRILYIFLSMLISIFFFVSCGKKKSINSGDLKIINLSKDQLSLIRDFKNSPKLSQELLITDFSKIISKNIFKDINYIKLETTPESLIGEIDKVVISNDKIFILDQWLAKNIFVFTLEGKFISKIKGIGEGPNELKTPLDFAINPESKEIAVFDGFMHKMVYYDYNLKPKREKKIFFRFINMRFLSGDKLLLSVGMSSNEHIADIDKHNLLMVDSSFNVIRKGFEFSMDETKNNFILRDHLHQNSASNVIYAPKFKNSVYQINNDGIIEKKFSINFTEQEVSKEYYKKDVQEMFRVVKEQNKFYYLGEYEENDKLIFLKLTGDMQKPHINIFYDKNTHKYTYGKYDYKNRINAENPFLGLPILTSYKDSFVTVLPSEILEQMRSDEKLKLTLSPNLKALIASSKKGDNPVIQTYKISLKDEKMF